jgi:hypothetical protein
MPGFSPNPDAIGWGEVKLFSGLDIERRVPSV